MEAHIQPCPVCGVGINATLTECPVCHSKTGFTQDDAGDAEHKCPSCGEQVPAKSVFCPMCGQRLSAAIPPPTPHQQTRQPLTQPQPAPQPTPPQPQKPGQSRMNKLIIGLIGLLAAAVLIMLIVTLSSKSSRNEEQPGALAGDIAMEHTLDSLKHTLPVSAREVMRYTNDKPSLFYLYDNRLHRIDGNTLDDETIDFEEANSNAKIDYRSEGIMDVRPTKDDRYLFVHASKDGSTHEQILMRYDAKTGRVNVLGTGRSIEEMGSGYRIVGENSEKKIDAYGNIVGDRGTDIALDDLEEEKPQAEQPRASKPAKPQAEETPQAEAPATEPQTTQPAAPTQPAEPPAGNNNTGFHLEEI